MLAGRYLRARRREAFISVIAGFSFIGIMLGVATLIIVMAVMNGFRAQLIDKILGLNGHLIVQAMDTPLNDYDSVSKRIAAVPGVASAIPLVEGQALASGSNASNGVLVRGIRDVDLPHIRGIADNVQLGSLVDFEASGGVAIGTRLAASLGLTIGSSLTLVSPNGNVTPLGVTPRIKAYPVTAIFEIGMSEYDSSFVFMPFAEAQAFFNLDNEASAIEIYLDNADLVDELRPAIEQAADRQVLLTDWQQRNVTFFSALEVERNVMFLILSLIILIAALNIISGLTMLVKEKGHAIAILRTMGATRGAIMRIFFIIGVVDRCDRNLRRIPARGAHFAEYRDHPRVDRIDVHDRRVFVGTLFPQSAPRRPRSWRNVVGHRHDARAVVSRHALSGVERGQARSGRSAAVRMNTEAPEGRESSAILRLRASNVISTRAASRLTVLSGADFDLFPGELVALAAPSGAGKSTLLQIAGLLERPDSGEVIIAGRSAGKLSDSERTAIRRVQIGFVYQFHHLLGEFSALENVIIPQLIRGLSKAVATQRAMQLLSYMRVKERASHRPAELSGGEQQRVAIARAVANAPRLLLADEPTGNLDPTTAGYVFDGLTRLVRASKLGALIATHNHDLAARMDRRITLRGGKVVELE